MAKPSFEAMLSQWEPRRTGRCVQPQVVHLTRKRTARCDIAVWISKTKVLAVLLSFLLDPV